MFAVDSFIDTVQSSKKYFVSNFVTDASMRTTLNEFVDAQTKYTKQLFKTANDLSSLMVDTVIKNYKGKE